MPSEESESCLQRSVAFFFDLSFQEGVEEAFMKTAAAIWEKMTNGKLLIKSDDVRFYE